MIPAHAFVLAASQPDQPSFIMGLLPLLPLLVLWYLFLIKPQRRKDKDHKAMLKRLTKDDKVMTVGGIHGVVAKIDDSDNAIVHIKISDRVTIRVSKAHIAAAPAEPATSTSDSKPNS
ncbi:MAG TPA: preprotein translocase subunit YajC [Lentisphaeria bacterium]|jgi:preprotein translocase subunit YajC|nr:preprotein translocase subunit YajC [Lentisphaeria bacterium]